MFFGNLAANSLHWKCFQFHDGWILDIGDFVQFTFLCYGKQFRHFVARRKNYLISCFRFDLEFKFELLWSIFLYGLATNLSDLK